MRVLRPSPSAAPALQCDVPFGEGRRFVHNELAVRGSARSSAGIAEVRVEIGSTRQAALLSGPDPARFESVIDTSTWRPSTTVLTVTMLDQAGREMVESGEVRVEPYAAPVSGKEAVAGTGTALHCRPLGPTAPHLPVSIRGWAYSRAGIERVAVFLDGRSCHEALHGLTRPQIQTRLGAPDALECGYYRLLDPYVCEPGEHVITVVATPREGPPVGVSRSFVCTDDTAVRGEGEPSVPAEPSPRPQAAPFDASTSRTADEARYRWVSRLAGDRALLDAGRELDDLGAPLSFKSDSFDLVICFHRLEEVDDRELALGELARVLRPRGLLVASWGLAELEPDLRRRFQHVRTYRQGEYATSIIVSDDTAGDVELDRPVPRGAVTIALASDGPLPDLPGLGLAGPDKLDQLRQTAEGWKERALAAEAEAAAKLTQLSQAQRGEERALLLLRAAQERQREPERRALRRLRRFLSRLRGPS